MCALAILFAYKAGLFNIGAAGQYCAGAALSALRRAGVGHAAGCAVHACWPWLGGALLGVISGLLKSYCNVNEVISGIMLNWIALYLINMLLTNVQGGGQPLHRGAVAHVNGGALHALRWVWAQLFNDNQYVAHGHPAVRSSSPVGLWIVLEKTRFGYELKATGNNKNAAKYCGMAEKRNIILTLAISGALAGLGAAMFYLTGYEQWQCYHLLRARHGLQRHRRGVSRRPEPHRHDSGLLLHPAYHRRRRVCG